MRSLLSNSIKVNVSKAIKHYFPQKMVICHTASVLADNFCDSSFKPPPFNSWEINLVWKRRLHFSTSFHLWNYLLKLPSSSDPSGGKKSVWFHYFERCFALKILWEPAFRMTFLWVRTEKVFFASGSLPSTKVQKLFSRKFGVREQFAQCMHFL